MLNLLGFIDWLLVLYMWLIFFSVIMSWLVSFQVVNPHNRVVHIIGNVLYQVTEPFVGRIRRFVPATGGVDFSPLIAFVIIVFIRMVILPELAKAIA